jgi:lipopolysaccharide transport system ATP-binding protein
MSDDAAIRVEGLSKRYTLEHRVERQQYVALRDVISHAASDAWGTAIGRLRGRATSVAPTDEVFSALDDVSFEVKRGEVLGVVGRNGAGKSTLLKILSRITEPSSGRVTLNGRVSSLLEVGTGFHPELTGRENIFLNGSILGMSRAEVRARFDEIVAFADVTKFLDTPVKRYSSGMYVRLAFAVAAHLEPEIMVVDEVLAVGDIAFQQKCLGKMSEVAGGGRTVLFVSHNMTAVQALCPRAILLESGRLVADGATAEIVSAYMDRRERRAKGVPIPLHPGLVLEHLRFSEAEIDSGSAVRMVATFTATESGSIRECAFALASMRGFRAALVDARECGALPLRYRPGRFSIQAEIASVPLVAGIYSGGLYLATDSSAKNYLDLDEVVVRMPATAHSYAPYPSEVQGVVVLKATASVQTSEPGTST